MWTNIFGLGDEIPDIADIRGSRPWGSRIWYCDPTMLHPKQSGKMSGMGETLAWVDNGDPLLGTPHNLAPRNIGALPPEPAALSNDLENGRRLAVPYG